MSDRDTDELIALARSVGILPPAEKQDGATGTARTEQPNQIQGSAGAGTAPAGNPREAAEDAATAELLALARRVGLYGYAETEPTP